MARYVVTRDGKYWGWAGWGSLYLAKTYDKETAQAVAKKFGGEAEED